MNNLPRVSVKELAHKIKGYNNLGVLLKIQDAVKKPKRLIVKLLS